MNSTVRKPKPEIMEGFIINMFRYTHPSLVFIEYVYIL